MILSVAVTASRWLTASPYSPVFIPYDTALYVLWGALAFLVARLGLRRTGSARVAAAIAAALLSGGLAYPWVVALSEANAGVGVRLACGILFSIAGIALVGRLRSGSGRRLPAPWFALAAALATTVSVAGSGTTWPLLAVFPTALAALFALGLPRLPGLPGPAALADRVPAALAVIAIATCAATVYPGSPELVDTPSATPPDPGPSAILVVLDTLRADHLPLYGYERPLTPNIDRWADGAAVFRDATSASSWTLPSHASLFTGLYPRTHGAHGYRPAGRAYPLSLATDTLAEIAARAGLATGAIIANHGNLDRRHQLDQGFQTYWLGVPRQGFGLPPVDRLVRRFHRWHLDEHRWHYYRDRHITDNVIRWLETARQRPFFLFVNYMDVHIPSARPPTPEVPIEDELDRSVHGYRFWRVRA